MINSSINLFLFFHLRRYQCPWRYIATKRESKKAEDADPALLEYTHYEEAADPTTTYYSLRSNDGTDIEMTALTSERAQPSDPCKNTEESYQFH